MLAGIFHEGSGLGDQLFRYITVRTLAEEKGVLYGMQGNFKGDFFLNRPETVEFFGAAIASWNEKKIEENGVDIRSYDPEINFVEDNTVIDGSFEDSKYWGHNLENINKWLAVEPLYFPDGKCLIGFRGGEYTTQKELFLGTEYYKEALQNKSFPFLDIFQYEVHTDDPKLAQSIFGELFAPHYLTIIPNEPISHSKHTNMALNWRSARYAKYAVIPNSAFFILPRLLKHHEDPTAVTIAPRYWARRNTKTWARPACYYKQFQYI